MGSVCRRLLRGHSITDRIIINNLHPQTREGCVQEADIRFARSSRTGRFRLPREESRGIEGGALRTRIRDVTTREWIANVAWQTLAGTYVISGLAIGVRAT